MYGLGNARVLFIFIARPVIERGAIRGSSSKPTIFSLRSTVGSPKASTRSI